MASNSFGDNFRITSFGESHGPAVGVVIDGVRPGLEFDLDAIQRELDRRRPGRSPLSSPRKEADRVELLSGVFEGKTTGTPIALLVRNRDARSRHYEQLKDVFRPGHADYTFWHKYGIRDWRGGGRSSARETVARVAAAGLARQVLAAAGVQIRGHVVRVGPVVARRFDPTTIEQNDVRCADPQAAERMADHILQLRKQGDSAGGVVEVRADGVPAGWGDPVFWKLDAQLAAGLMSIGAVKGVEIGGGFALAERRGSESNDPLTPRGFASNRMGGILGGISNGEPIVVRIAVKPTSSIRHAQQTVDTAGRPREIRVPGRHDPCICPRVVPVAEAMVALVLCDAHLRQEALTGEPVDPDQLVAELAYRDGEVVRALQRREQVARQLAQRGGLPADSQRELDSSLESVCGEAGFARGIPRRIAELLAAIGDRPSQE